MCRPPVPWGKKGHFSLLSCLFFGGRTELQKPFPTPTKGRAPRHWVPVFGVGGLPREGKSRTVAGSRDFWEMDPARVLSLQSGTLTARATTFGTLESGNHVDLSKQGHFVYRRFFPFWPAKTTPSTLKKTHRRKFPGYVWGQPSRLLAFAPAGFYQNSHAFA